MIEINLIPDIKQELIKTQHVRSAVIASSLTIGIASIVVVVLLSSFVFGVQALRNKSADDAITKGSTEVLSFKDLSKTLTIQNQLTKISSLNSSKNIYSRTFDILGAIIPPAPNDIKISSLSVDSVTASVIMDGQAQNSYAALEIFKKTIEGAIFNYNIDGTKEQQHVALASNVSTSDTSYGEDSTGAKVLRFTLGFTYSPEVFSPSSKASTITITVNGNVTDSYLGIPKSIFADPAIDLPEAK